MGGATSVMPVIRGVFSQQAANITQWVDTIDWTVRCDWLQVASSCIHAQYNTNEGCKTCASVARLVVSFIIVVNCA